MTAIVYTDASHCKNRHIAACSFVVLVNGRVIKHQVILIEECKKSKEAEVYGIIQGLQWAFLLPDVTEIVLYTDYRPIIEYRGINKSFIADIPSYQVYMDTLEMIRDYGIEVKIKWVKAHSTDKMNRKVDTAARYHLRKYLKQTKQSYGRDYTISSSRGNKNC